MANPLHRFPHQALPGPFAHHPSPDGIAPSPVVSQFVATQVKALLDSSPAFYQLPEDKRDRMRRDLEKIASYSAALIQDEWAASEKLGQVPVLREQTIISTNTGASDSSAEQPASVAHKAVASAAASRSKSAPAEEFSPRAATNVAKITGDTLKAIAFPTFVADLIKGTFDAIVTASIKQMEAYGQLLSNVAKTVDQFMADNITDNNARDYLASSYPNHFRVETDGKGPRVKLRDGADEREKPDFKSQFGLNSDVDLSDDAIEEQLVPAARRHLAKSRQQLLATMVLMGINRIVVTSGRIAAKMGFRIDTTDTGKAQTASQFDTASETSASGGFIFGHVEAKSSVAYVSSTKKDSSDEIDVHADLTGEVDLKFKSDYFPMERFAKPEMLALIQGNTPNPAANSLSGKEKSADKTQ